MYIFENYYNLQPIFDVIHPKISYFFFGMESITSSKRAVSLFFHGSINIIFQMTDFLHPIRFVSSNETNIDLFHNFIKLVSYISKQLLICYRFIITRPADVIFPEIIVMFLGGNPMRLKF